MILGVSASDIRVKSYKSTPTNTPVTRPSIETKAQELPQGYYPPSFTGVLKKDELKENYTFKSKEIVDRASALAKNLGHKETNHFHLARIIYGDILDYINELDSGKTSYGENTTFNSIGGFESTIAEDIFKKDEERAKIKPVFESEIQRLDTVLKNIPKSGVQLGKPKLSDDLYRDIYVTFTEGSEDGIPTALGDGFLLDSIIYPGDENLRQKHFQPFLMKLKNAVMIDETPDSEKPHLKFYDEKARNVLNNLAVGTSMFVVNEKNVKADYLINSVEKLLQTSEEGFGKLNKSNTVITRANKYADHELIVSLVKKAKKDPEHNHIIVFNMDHLNKNFGDDDDYDYATSMSETLREYYKKPPENVRFVVIQDKDKYYQNNASGSFDNPFKYFGEVSVPIINATQAKNVLENEQTLLKKEEIDKPFTSGAIAAIVNATVKLDGHYPEKALKIMKLMSSYFIDKDKIHTEDANKYITDAKHIFKTADDDSSVNVIFDTGKKTGDIVGKDATRKEAESIVRMIKDHSIGTKGYVIFSQDGYVGAGRKHMAKSIAGEAEIPYVEINALDFGTKDVDLFGSGNLSPEASIKKLFSLIKAQAEANPDKGAVLFIENFEYFSMGELVSEYHQKAMAQLLREMEATQKQGLNIVVMGSTSDPEFIGDATLKSFKFIDKVEVESPSGNPKAGLEILKYHANKKDLKIAGETEEEKMEVLKSAAETTAYFPYVMLLAFLDKAKSVAKERSHEAITKGDFTEAYLQITTGRPSSHKLSEQDKELVTTHECGHAITLQVMYDLAKKTNKEWLLPNKVNFIALDPRSSYLGVVYSKRSENAEYNFETVFSDLVMYYGGHSTEKHFYDQDGSWGITYDMEAAAKEAEMAVLKMGIGPKTGKWSIGRNGIDTLDVSEKLKGRIETDIENILKGANLASDKIIEAYEGFIKEFTEKYKDKVGTGDCIIPSEEFQAHLKDWLSHQDEATLQKIKSAEEEIKGIMIKTKKGEIAE